MGGSELGEGEDYDGPWGIARDSTWLTSEDLPHDRDVVVTIESVRLHRALKFQGGRDKPLAFVAKFVGRNRALLLNSGHRKVLGAMFGSPRKCAGKSVYLYVEQDVRRPDGTRGPAVRIRAKRVEAPKGGAAPVNPISDEPEPGSNG